VFLIELGLESFVVLVWGRDTMVLRSNTAHRLVESYYNWGKISKWYL